MIMSADDNTNLVDGLSGGETIALDELGEQLVSVIWGEDGVEVPTDDTNVISADARATAVTTDVATVAVGDLVTRTVDGRAYRVASILKDTTGDMTTLYLEFTD